MTRGEFKGKLTELLDEYIQDNPMFQPLDETYIFRTKKYLTQVDMAINQICLEKPDLEKIMSMPTKPIVPDYPRDTELGEEVQNIMDRFK